MIEGTYICIYTPLVIMSDALMHDSVLYILSKQMIIRYKFIICHLLASVQFTNLINLKFRNTSHMIKVSRHNLFN